MSTLTVRELREAIAGLEDSAPVFCNGIEADGVKTTASTSTTRAGVSIECEAPMIEGELCCPSCETPVKYCIACGESLDDYGQ